MAAPETWGTPTSDGALASTVGFLSHANGYWFAMSFGAATMPTVRYADDPTGTWSTATMPTPPTGYTFSPLPLRARISHDGTHYAFGITIRNSSLGQNKTYAVHATSPGGTWSLNQIGTATDLNLQAMISTGGTFVAVGHGWSGGAPWIAYSTAADGTWTVNTTQATTGYAPADGWEIEDIAWDGSQYVTVATDSLGTDGARYSSSIDSSWGTVSSFPNTFATRKQLRYDSGADIWTIADRLNLNYYYAADPTGTWTSVGTALTGMTNGVQAITYGAGSWVAGGQTKPGTYVQPRLAYYMGSDPNGTYAEITSPFTSRPTDDESAYDVLWAENYFVALSRYFGEIRYCYAPPPPTPVGPRRRALGTSFHLRQRQTPYIR